MQRVFVTPFFPPFARERATSKKRRAAATTREEEPRRRRRAKASGRPGQPASSQQEDMDAGWLLP